MYGDTSTPFICSVLGFLFKLRQSRITIKYKLKQNVGCEKYPHSCFCSDSILFYNTHKHCTLRFNTCAYGFPRPACSTGATERPAPSSLPFTWVHSKGTKSALHFLGWQEEPCRKSLAIKVYEFNIRSWCLGPMKCQNMSDESACSQKLPDNSSRYPYRGFAPVPHTARARCSQTVPRTGYTRFCQPNIFRPALFTCRSACSSLLLTFNISDELHWSQHYIKQ